MKSPLSAVRAPRPPAANPKQEETLRQRLNGSKFQDDFTADVLLTQRATRLISLAKQTARDQKEEQRKQLLAKQSSDPLVLVEREEEYFRAEIANSEKWKWDVTRRLLCNEVLEKVISPLLHLTQTSWEWQARKAVLMEEEKGALALAEEAAELKSVSNLMYSMSAELSGCDGGGGGGTTGLFAGDNMSFSLRVMRVDSKLVVIDVRPVIIEEQLARSAIQGAEEGRARRAIHLLEEGERPAVQERERRRRHVERCDGWRRQKQERDRRAVVDAEFAALLGQLEEEEERARREAAAEEEQAARTLDAEAVGGKNSARLAEVEHSETARRAFLMRRAAEIRPQLLVAAEPAARDAIVRSELAAAPSSQSFLEEAASIEAERERRARAVVAVQRGYRSVKLGHTGWRATHRRIGAAIRHARAAKAAEARKTALLAELIKLKESLRNEEAQLAHN